MALTKSAVTVQSSTSNSAAGTTRAAVDLTGAYGAILTAKITNGGTGPTLQCVCTVMVAHNASTPSTGARGADWKVLTNFGGGVTSSAITEFAIPLDPAVMQAQVEFSGNTGQAVTVEAFLSKITAL